MPDSKDFMTNYLKRINDLENPLPQDNKLFLPERKVKASPGPAYSRTEVKMTGSRTKEENERLRAEYLKNVEGPATETLTSFPEDTITEVLDGKAWIVPNLLSEAECEEVIQLGEDWGIGEEDFKVSQELRIRTSNRTNSYCNEELTIRINPRLPEELLDAMEASLPYTSVRGIHPNWRVARYQEGQTFPAHQDQADSVIVRHQERARQRYTSSHTLIINLRKPGQDYQGGATRFFMDGEASFNITNIESTPRHCALSTILTDPNSVPVGTYSGRTVDICVPQGWALVFQQRGLFHAGMPLKGPGTKYIAQAGVLRGEPEPGVVTGPAAVFKYAPGIRNY